MNPLQLLESPLSNNPQACFEMAVFLEKHHYHPDIDKITRRKTNYDLHENPLQPGFWYNRGMQEKGKGFQAILQGAAQGHIRLKLLAGLIMIRNNTGGPLPKGVGWLDDNKTRDVLGAESLFKQVANQGVAKGHIYLARVNQNRMPVGVVSPTSINILREAAKLNDIEGQYKLGYYLSLDHQYDEARYWLNIAMQRYQENDFYSYQARDRLLEINPQNLHATIAREEQSDLACEVDNYNGALIHYKSTMNNLRAPIPYGPITSHSSRPNEINAANRNMMLYNADVSKYNSNVSGLPDQYKQLREKCDKLRSQGQQCESPPPVRKLSRAY